MSSDRVSQRAGTPESIKAAGDIWRGLYEELREAAKSAHPGAGFLAYHAMRMADSSDRLLELGLDVSNLSDPRVVPVPVARHPKTKAEVRRWEDALSYYRKQHILSFSVAAVGTHVVRSAVGDETLMEVLGRRGDVIAPMVARDFASLARRSDLAFLALASSFWLSEPTGTMKSSAARLDTACFNRMLYAFEINPLIDAHRQAKDDTLPTAERVASADVAAGWSLANLSLSGKPGTALRRALGEEAPLTKQYELFLQELPSASLIAWEDSEPTEPLRSTGHLDKNLARRVAEIVEKSGNEGATKPGKLVRDAPGTEGEERAKSAAEHFALPDPLLDPLLGEFELRETARQELAQLKGWLEAAELTEAERRVYELDMRSDHATASIARELGKTESTVRGQRRSYIAKIRKVAGL